MQLSLKRLLWLSKEDCVVRYLLPDVHLTRPPSSPPNWFCLAVRNDPTNPLVDVLAGRLVARDVVCRGTEQYVPRTIISRFTSNLHENAFPLLIVQWPSPDCAARTVLPAATSVT